MPMSIDIEKVSVCEIIGIENPREKTEEFYGFRKCFKR